MKRFLLVLAVLTATLAVACAQPKLVTELVYEADLSAVAGSPDEAITEAIDIIKMRLDAYDVRGASVQRQGTNVIFVQLPKVEHLDAVVRVIGASAQLDFRELTNESWQLVQGLPAPDYQSLTEQGTIEWIPATGIDSEGEEVYLTGAYLKRNARVEFNPTTGEPEFHFELTSEGADLFAQITSRLIGRPLGIFLDDAYVSSPIVKGAITGGSGVIENMGSLEEAKRLTSLLNYGAFPCPLELISRRSLE